MSIAVRCLLLTLLLLAGSAGTGQGAAVVSRLPCELPEWSKAVHLTDVEKYSTEAEYDSARNSRFALEKVRYRSDGLAVVAYYYHPIESEGPKRPVIVFNRGSYVRTDIASELLTMFYRLAREGFVIVAPMYRGSDGGEGRDEMGGADLDDLMNIVPVLAELETPDTSNVFLYGESRGGMMVFQAIRDGFPARAAATFGAFTDLGEMTSSEQGGAMARSIWPDFEARRDEIITRRSAIQWPERLRIPLLLMHGSADPQVPPSQTLLLAAQISKAQKAVAVTVFPGGNHTIQQYRIERDRQVVEFFRRYRRAE